MTLPKKEHYRKEKKNLTILKSNTTKKSDWIKIIVKTVNFSQPSCQSVP